MPQCARIHSCILRHLASSGLCWSSVTYMQCLLHCNHLSNTIWLLSVQSNTIWLLSVQSNTGWLLSVQSNTIWLLNVQSCASWFL